MNWKLNKAENKITPATLNYMLDFEGISYCVYVIIFAHTDICIYLQLRNKFLKNLNFQT